MEIIALTGGIASGKNTVADIFHEKYEVPVIDTDEIAKDIVQDGSVLLNRIIEKFGLEILNNDKTLNRRKLRERIFHSPEDKKWLEQLLHPVINIEMQNQIKLYKHELLADNSPINYCLLLIPLVNQAYLEKNPFITRVLVVDSTEQDQINRGQMRDGQSKEQIANIIKQQISREERIKLADDVIVNDQDIAKLEREVDRLHTLYQSL